MRVRVGTSGFSYAEWRGSFYPKGLKPPEMLRFYAQRLSTVEINNTFYRMPKADAVAGWYEQTPDAFSFVLKASQRITHQQRLKDCSESVAYLFRLAAILRDKLGPILFQLPPFLRKDVPLLNDFLAALPEGCRAAFEFRHPSWFDDAVYATLSQHGASLCLADVDEDNRSTPLVGTTGWGYLRLRRESYTEADLDAWAARIAEQAWDQAHVFFKHEILGPVFAEALAARCEEGRPPVSTPLAELIRAAQQAAAGGTDPEAPATGAGSGEHAPADAAAENAPVKARQTKRPRRAKVDTPPESATQPQSMSAPQSASQPEKLGGATPESRARGTVRKARRPSARKVVAGE